MLRNTSNKKLRTSVGTKDDLFQQQVTLRTMASDISTIWQISRIGWAWRSLTTGFLRISIALILIYSKLGESEFESNSRFSF